MKPSPPESAKHRAGRPRATFNSRLLQITPGLQVAPVPLAAVPTFGIVEWHRRPDGTFEPKLITGEQWIPLSNYPAKELGIPVSRTTLQRLARAGFIRVRKPTPDCIQLHLGSLIEHCENVEDPEFWTPERIRKFKEAL